MDSRENVKIGSDRFGDVIIIITFISIARIQLYSFQMRFTMIK